VPVLGCLPPKGTRGAAGTRAAPGIAPRAEYSPLPGHRRADDWGSSEIRRLPPFRAPSSTRSGLLVTQEIGRRGARRRWQEQRESTLAAAGWAPGGSRRTRIAARDPAPRARPVRPCWHPPTFGLRRRRSTRSNGSRLPVAPAETRPRWGRYPGDARARPTA